ncbi:hypothetical protein AB0K18_12795 [Nonomuraea sp. NPDC049421]|uniref:hypothetical protein n=1 Tax=Nonomuraea sp. NPDC049421 TaxID=3155275 RepID=UPI0034379A1F
MHSQDVLLIGGRAGSGKSTTGYEVSRLLRAADVAHCLIEGDNLCEAHPAPDGDPHRTAMTEANLAAVWANYAALGYRRLIYTNTVSVLEADLITRAMSGGPVRVIGVMLTATDATVAERLGGRERGSGFEEELHRSTRGARLLEREAGDWVARVRTDSRSVAEIAEEIAAFTGWLKETNPPT